MLPILILLLQKYRAVLVVNKYLVYFYYYLISLTNLVIVEYI